MPVNDIAWGEEESEPDLGGGFLSRLWLFFMMGEVGNAKCCGSKLDRLVWEGWEDGW